MTCFFLCLCHSGGYIYSEASEPQRNGYRALLMGPRMCGRMCLQFYYSMNGNRIGALNIYRREGMNHDDLIWTLSGNQGKEWHEALVDVGGACYQVRINDDIIVLKSLQLDPGSIILQPHSSQVLRHLVMENTSSSVYKDALGLKHIIQLQIIFEGVIGPSYLSDIAVDDIYLSKGNMLPVKT